jgi:hypothetical protein
MPKIFDPSISSAFPVNIIIVKTDLTKYIVGDNRIFETGYIIKKIVRIDYYPMCH